MRVAPATSQPLPVYLSFPVIPAAATNAAGAWDARLHHLLEFDNGARALVTELLADGTVVAAPLSGDAVGAQARARCAESPLTFPVGAGLTGESGQPLCPCAGGGARASAASPLPPLPPYTPGTNPPSRIPPAAARAAPLNRRRALRPAACPTACPTAPAARRSRLLAAGGAA